MDWILLATEANSGSLFKCDDVYLFLLIFPRTSLHCKLVPVQYRVYEYMVCRGLSWGNISGPGAHYWEPVTTPYSRHDVFKDRSIFSLNLSRIQILTQVRKWPIAIISTDCRCIGLLWEFQAPSNGLLRCMRSNYNLEVLVYVGASFLFLYLFLSLPPYLLISLFTYFFLSLSFYFFALSLCHSFYFVSIFLEPEPKLFHVIWVNKLHWHFNFYMGCNGKTKQHR